MTQTPKIDVGMLISVVMKVGELHLSTSCDVYCELDKIRDVTLPIGLTGIVIYIHEQWLDNGIYPEMCPYAVFVTLPGGTSGVVRLESKEFRILDKLR